VIVNFLLKREALPTPWEVTGKWFLRVVCVYSHHMHFKALSVNEKKIQIYNMLVSVSCKWIQGVGVVAMGHLEFCAKKFTVWKKVLLEYHFE
jgi:hypothetical protein